GGQASQVLDVGESGIAPRISGQTEVVHGCENAIHADERQVKVQLAKGFVQHAAAGLGEPVEGAREHAEDGGYAHNHVEVADHEVGVVEVQVESRLAEEDAAHAAGHEQRHEAKGEHHGSVEMDLAVP